MTLAVNYNMVSMIILADILSSPQPLQCNIYDAHGSKSWTLEKNDNRKIGVFEIVLPPRSKYLPQSSECFLNREEIACVGTGSVSCCCLLLFCFVLTFGSRLMVQDHMVLDH